MASSCPPANAIVQMEILLPISGNGSEVRMKADMMVLRVEHDVSNDKRSGFSLIGNGFSLHTSSKKAAERVAQLIKDSGENMLGKV